jgi:hypothetical protein
MVSIVGASEVKRMTDARKVTEKIENKSITARVNDVFGDGSSGKKTGGSKGSSGGGIIIKGKNSRPAPSRRPQQPALDPRVLEQLVAQTQYQEYKTSIREAIHYGMTLIERNPSYKDGLKQKICASRDIRTILDNKLRGVNLIENEWLVLGLTLCSKVIENRLLGGSGASVPSDSVQMNSTDITPEKPTARAGSNDAFM